MVITIDLSHRFDAARRRWVIGRRWEPDPPDLRQAEKQCASDLGVEYEDYGCGLSFLSEHGAAVTAELMMSRDETCGPLWITDGEEIHLLT